MPQDRQFPTKADPQLAGLVPGDRIHIGWVSLTSDARMIGKNATIVRHVLRGVIIEFDQPIGAAGTTFMLGLDPDVYSFEKISAESTPKPATKPAIKV